MSDSEALSLKPGSVLFFDVECYVNFFFIAFKSAENGKYITFEQSPSSILNIGKLNWILWRFCIVGFNSRNYDLPIIECALKGFNCKALKDASNFIIKEKTNLFAFQKAYKIRVQNYNHIDLIEVCPLQGSLKLYAGRLHCKIMQDLPFQEDSVLTEDDAKIVRPYCCVDLNNTELIFNKLKPELQLRKDMSQKYGVDLMSKSDAQIAEAVINSELEKASGRYPKRPKFNQDLILKYNIPDFISFESPQLKSLLEIVRNTQFTLDKNGKPCTPKELEKLIITIGNTNYTVKKGGLHSKEKSMSHVATENIIIADNDVASFYPRIILNQNLHPDHLGTAFLDVYENIVNTRIDAKGKAKAAKKSGNAEEAKHFKTIADSLKITINGSFGKLGNKYSTLYAPQLMLQVTITGQLVLLMLIEMIEAAGIPIVSGNTDGIIAKYHKDEHEKVRSIIALWEKRTNFETEETRYSAVYSRDVNSYIAIKEGDGYAKAEFLDERLNCKTKGTYCERGSALNSVLSKNPETLICSDAVLQFLKNKIPVEKTIKECKDIRRFITVRNVKGGAVKNGVYLGKVVRFYYPKNETGFISYLGSGNKVAKTDNARPLMDLPDELPNDINYNWYIETAIDMLKDCEGIKVAKQTTLFF